MKKLWMLGPAALLVLSGCPLGLVPKEKNPEARHDEHGPATSGDPFNGTEPDGGHGGTSTFPGQDPESGSEGQGGAPAPAGAGGARGGSGGRGGQASPPNSPPGAAGYPHSPAPTGPDDPPGGNSLDGGQPGNDPSNAPNTDGDAAQPNPPGPPAAPSPTPDDPSIDAAELPEGQAPDAGFGDGRPVPPREARDWIGRWSGHSAFRVKVGTRDRGEPTEHDLYETRFLSLEIKITDYEPAEPGWVNVGGRLAAGHCILTTEFQGRLFIGDELSPATNQLFQATALGQSDLGLPVYLTFSMKREAGLGTNSWLTGRVRFDSMDMRQPCFEKDLLTEFPFFASEGASNP